MKEIIYFCLCTMHCFFWVRVILNLWHKVQIQDEYQSRPAQRFWPCHEKGFVKAIPTIPHNLHLSFKFAKYWSCGFPFEPTPNSTQPDFSPIFCLCHVQNHLFMPLISTDVLKIECCAVLFRLTFIWKRFSRAPMYQ